MALHVATLVVPAGDVASGLMTGGRLATGAGVVRAPGLTKPCAVGQALVRYIYEAAVEPGAYSDIIYAPSDA
jgi:hypothetical protein